MLHDISPSEGNLGEGLHLYLQGEGFEQLHELVDVRIAGVKIPFSDYTIEDNQTILVFLQIPEQIPTGDQKITFSFDTEITFAAPFTVLEPGEVAPVLYGVTPQEGHPGEEILLHLDAEDLSPLGGLQRVQINGVGAPLLDYNLNPEEPVQVLLHVPPNAPLGEGEIIFTFENGDLEAYFAVLPPEVPAGPVLQGLSPQEGLVAVQVRLQLAGENLTRLGVLQTVQLNNTDLSVVDYQVVSDQAVEVLVQLPPDIPTGDGQMAVFFDNAVFESPFRVIAGNRGGIPPGVWVAVVLGAGLLGWAGWRRISRRPAQPSPAQRPPQNLPPEFHFMPRMDPGAQTVEVDGPSIRADIDIRLVAIPDRGQQSVETGTGSLTGE